MERIEVYSSRLLQRQERTYIPISVSPKRRERGKSVWGVRPFSTMRISWEPSYSSTQGLVLSYEELACCFLHRGHLQISISWRVAHLRYCHYLCGKKEEFLILVFPRAVEQGASVQKPLFCCLQMRGCFVYCHRLCNSHCKSTEQINVSPATRDAPLVRLARSRALFCSSQTLSLPSRCEVR